jgi:NTE family protein
MKKLLRRTRSGRRGVSAPDPRSSDPPSPGGGKKLINLALQGGGAHGAFTWGVLDHLLEDGRLQFEGVSGTSAGAVNAILLADGLARGGRTEAQKRLADFWRAASVGGSLPALQRAVIERLFSFLPLDESPMQVWLDALSRYFSPYTLNPLNINPLKSLIERFVDFDAVRAYEDLQLFISATNIHTGRLRVFSRDKITADVVMASACLPFVFQAVEIDGVPYWDGGYLGNPAIFPFFHTTATEDVLLVQLNPLERKITPTSSREIMNRVNEITFNSSLLSEYRAIDFVARLIQQQRLPHGTGPGQYRLIKLHRIVLDGSGRAYTADTKLSNDYDFFELMRTRGRQAAQRFLDAHFDDINVRSTVDLIAEAHAEWA